MGLDVCVVGMIQRALWEAGMQRRHGVLENCLHVPPGLHKTHSYSRTFHTVRDLSSPQDKEEFFRNCISMHCYTQYYALTKPTTHEM